MTRQVPARVRDLVVREERLNPKVQPLRANSATTWCVGQSFSLSAAVNGAVNAEGLEDNNERDLTTF